MSGYKWAGTTHYRQVPFRRLFRPVHRPSVEGAGIVTAYTDGSVTLRSRRAKIGYHEATDTSTYKGVHRGDFVVHGLDIMRGSVGVSDSDGVISPVCIVCEPVAPLDPRFMAHYMRNLAAADLPRALARGVREGGADFRRWDTLAEIPLPDVPPDEQRAIADYLDRETAQIDAFIAKNEDLIRLAIERQASQIARILETAAAEQVPLRYTSRVIDCKHVTTAPAGADSPFLALSVREVGGKYATLTTSKRVDHTDFQHLSEDGRELHAGELLMCRNTSFGKASLIPELPPGARATMGQDVALIRPRPEVLDSNWAYYAICSSLVQSQIQSLSKGSTIKRINVDQIRTLKIPLPSLNAQRDNVVILEQVDDRASRLVDKANTVITLAKERRAALISAAVTGKIDVRSAT